jgi:alpha-glucosidase
MTQPGRLVVDGVHGAQGWWRDAVVYEVYLRSFADSDGDGVGDLPGLRSRLPYLAELGVDAIWVSPWYPSPMVDGGYDITDHLGVDPRYGTLEDVDDLVRDAHELGLRVVVDLVANHTSRDHPWFRTALASPPGSRDRARYHFHDGRGPGGDLPPNDWVSAFGGSAWSRTVAADGRPGQWYLHQFSPAQPDLNWEDGSVAEEFDRVVRCWLDLGVDGIRVDAAPAMAKAPGLPDAGHGPDPVFASHEWTDSPHWDRPEVHDILRRWRGILDGYGGDRVLVTEAVVSSQQRLAAYLRPDEAHTAFNFEYLKAPWDPAALRAVVDRTLAGHAAVGAPATWVLSSHDETRHVTRYGRTSTSATIMGWDEARGGDVATGRRRARAALLLMLALPGSAYLYQGEELGLEEVEDLPDDVREDPTWHRSGGAARGRDGCRVPLPWSGSSPPFGFGPDAGQPWLPQPSRWAERTVSHQLSDPTSELNLYRRALACRRELAAARSGALTWLPLPPHALGFALAGGLVCVVAFDGPVGLDGLGEVVLSSTEPDSRRVLQPDTSAWLLRMP